MKPWQRYSPTEKRKIVLVITHWHKNRFYSCECLFILGPSKLSKNDVWLFPPKKKNNTKTTQVWTIWISMFVHQSTKGQTNTTRDMLLVYHCLLKDIHPKFPIGVGPRVLEDFIVLDKWEEFWSHYYLIMDTIFPCFWNQFSIEWERCNATSIPLGNGTTSGYVHWKCFCSDC